MSGFEVESMMRQIMAGSVGTPEIESFLLALRNRGETVEEISSAARVMREFSVKISRPYPDLLDTCGTGGDAKNTLNVSTLAAIIASAAGARIAKHGNRSVSSVCGSADLLEFLGMKINLLPTSVERCIEKTGFGFFFAPNFHPATKAAMPARKNIQGKTLFNLLGPLTNPAGARHQLLGVYEERLAPLLANVLLTLGTQRALVVHGFDGLDEISLSGPTQVAEIQGGSIKSYRFTPEEVGLKSASLDSIQTHSKEESGELALRILGGAPGPGSDIVCLNAGAALYVIGMVRSIREGFVLAHETIQLGKALQKLDELVRVTQGLE